MNNLKLNVKANMMKTKIKVPAKIGLRYGVDNQEYEAKCYVSNFLKLMMILSGDGTYNSSFYPKYYDFTAERTYSLVTDRTSGIRYAPQALQLIQDNPNGRVAKEFHGISVGRGNTATNWLDTTILDDIVENGNGTGQLEYGALDTSLGVDSTDPNKMFWKITRTVTNNSGANVELKEMGLFCAGGYYNLIEQYSAGVAYLLARDVLESTVVIADGETKTFFYSFCFEKGSGWTLTRFFLENLRYAMTNSNGESEDKFSPNKIVFSNDTGEMEQAPASITGSVEHGVEDDTLFYFAMNYNISYAYEEQSTKSIWTIRQPVWNFGSTSITVQKVYVRNLNNEYFAGKKLDTALVIPANSGAMVEYQIEVGV